MNTSSDRTLLKQLLDLSDSIDQSRGMQREAPTPDERDRLGHLAEVKIQEVARLLRNLDHEGPLHHLLRRYRLGPQHVLILLGLLKRRLHHEDPFVTGRELVSTLFDSSFTILDGVRLLSPGSRLIQAQLIFPDLSKADEDMEILDLRFRLSDRAFRILCRVLKRNLSGLKRGAEQEARPYKSNLAYVMDLRRLSQLYQKRAAKIFHYEEWDDFEAGFPESITLLNREIMRTSALVRARLEQTEGKERFPLHEIATRFGLAEDHLVVLVTLIFQELTQGNPYLDAVDLLKLVSRSEEDLVRRRKLFSRSSPLLRHGLVALDEIVHDKEICGEVYVPNSVIETILGGHPVKDSEIDADSRIDFHKFLSDLDDSEDFFKNL